MALTPEQLELIEQAQQLAHDLFRRSSLAVVRDIDEKLIRALEIERDGKVPRRRAQMVDLATGAPVE